MELLDITLPQLLIVAGLLMLLAELVVGIDTGFDLVLIGSILIISGFAGVLFGSTPLALVLTVGLSVLYIAVGRKQIKQRISVVTTTKTNIDKLLGATGTVERPINPNSAGIVRVDDEHWRASAEEVLYEGDPVVIESIEGVTVLVRKLNK